MAAQGALTDFYEALARKQQGQVPEGYGYSADVALGVGFYKEQRLGVSVLEKPIVIPTGTASFQGYMLFFAYCTKEGVESILSGQFPPALPATTKEPHTFESLAKIADNFGYQDPTAGGDKCKFCVAFRVPASLANQAETPGRDIWMLMFSNDKVVPFLIAVKESDKGKVDKYLKDGMSSDTADEDGVTGLMSAAFNGDLEICQTLVSKGACTNSTELINQRTSLMFAAQGGHTEVVEFLLNEKADPTMKDSDGSTAMMWAALAGKAPTVRCLATKAGADAKNSEGLNALQIAEKIGHVEVIAALRS